MLALVNGEIRTCGPERTLDQGTILIDGGKIVDVGNRVAVPDGTETIDCAGMILTPGCSMQVATTTKENLGALRAAPEIAARQLDSCGTL